jgi:hypothetical protein
LRIVGKPTENVNLINFRHAGSIQDQSPDLPGKVRSPFDETAGPKLSATDWGRQTYLLRIEASNGLVN